MQQSPPGVERKKLEQTPGGDESPKNSNGDNSFEEHSVTDVEPEHRKPPSDTPGRESHSIMTNFDENSLIDNPIFKQLCDASKFRDSKTCMNCNKEFGMLRAKKNCHFCGNAICEACSPKKRANPSLKTEFQRVCEKCDVLYLKKRIFDEYQAKKAEREKKIEKKMMDLTAQQQVLKSLTFDLEKLRADNKTENEQLEDGQRVLREKNAQYRAEVEKVEKDNQKQSEAIKELNEKLTESKVQLEEKEKLLEEKKGLIDETCKKIQAREEDIKNVNQTIHEAEQQLTMRVEGSLLRQREKDDPNRRAEHMPGREIDRQLTGEDPDDDSKKPNQRLTEQPVCQQVCTIF